DEVSRGPVQDLRVERLHLRGHAGVQVQVAFDLQKPVADQCERLVERDVLAGRMVALVQQVGQFGLAGVAFPRGRHNDDATARIAAQNILDLDELTGIRDAGAPELAGNTGHGGAKVTTRLHTAYRELQGIVRATR